MTSASAAAPDEIGDVADVVAKATVTLDGPQMPTAAGDAFVLGESEAEVEPSGGITIAGAADPLSVGLSEHATRPGQLTEDGSVVYKGDAGVDVVAQILDETTVRVQTVISGPSASHEASYELTGGFTPVEASDGTYVAYRITDSGEFEAYKIHDAWATDAAGQPVDTHYEISGNTLTQVVTPAADTVYPIVADPTWEWYSAAYGAGFNKAETRNLASAGAVAGFCGLLPGPFAVACGVLGAQWWTVTGMAANDNACVFIAVVPAPLAVRYDSANCT